MNDQRDMLLDQAFSAYNKGDMNTAETLARDVLSFSPQHGDALFLLGLIAYRAGALSPAEELLYQAVKLYPDILRYHMALAGVLTASQRYQEALDIYERHTNIPEATLQSAYIYMAMEQKEKARELFLQAKNAGVSEAVLGLATLARQEGKLKEAKALLEQAPLVGNTFYQLSLIDVSEKKYERALTEITQALERDNLDIYWIQKGVVLESMGRLEDALAAYQQAREMNPYNAVAMMNEANIYAKQGHTTWAEEYYKRALQQDNTLLDAYQNLAALLVKQGRLTEALEHYRVILMKHPHQIDVLYNLALILEQIGEVIEAVGIYFNILSLGGKIRGMDARIAKCLKQAVKDKKTRQLAQNYAKGWVASFPQSKIAAKTKAIVMAWK